MGIWWIIIGISGVWVMSEVLLAILKRSKSGSAKTQDKSSLSFLWVVIVVSLISGIICGLNGVWRFSWTGPWLSYAGLALIIAGLIVRWLAIVTLNRYFTVDVSVGGDHRIVRKGIYAHIRHPAYSGSLLSFFGLSLVFSSYLSLILIFVPITIAFMYRVRVEEEALRRVFGEEYSAYCRKTRRFLPFIY